MYCCREEESKKKKHENRNEICPDTVKPISFELGGRRVLQGLTKKLAEARGGELNAVTALRRLRLVLERTVVRAKADALNATTADEEQANLRKTLRETEREGEGD